MTPPRQNLRALPLALLLVGWVPPAFAAAGLQGEVGDHWRALLSANQVTLGDRASPDFLTLGGLAPRDGQRINVVSANPNLGDNLIDNFPKITELHRRYPHSEIHVISPTSHVLARTDWLVPVTLPVKAFLVDGPGNPLLNDPDALLRALKDGLAREIAPHSFSFVDELGFDRLGSQVADIATDLQEDGGPPGKESAIRELTMSEVRVASLAAQWLPRHLASIGAQAIGQGRVRHGWLYRLTDASYRPPAFLEPGLEHEPGSATWSLRLMPDLEEGSFATQLDRAPTIYGKRRMEGQLLFGRGFSGEIPREWFAGLSKEKELRSFLESAFPGEPRPFAIVNMNTAGRYKVRLGKEGYVRRVREATERILRSGGTHVLITPPEAPYGPEIAAQVRRFVKSRRGRVAFLPEDRGIWDRAVAEAKFVVSTDSGMVHVANRVLGPERVATFSVGQDAAELWREDWQQFAIIPKGSGSRTVGASTLRWIDSWEEPGEKGCWRGFLRRARDFATGLLTP